MIDLKALTFNELQLFVVHELNEPAYRAEQIFSWLHRGAESVDSMSNLPISLRIKLKKKTFITRPLLLSKKVSAIDGTEKYLWGLQDHECVESVLMKYHHGNSLCLSTQVGCRMGCVFCASTKNGLVRNLSASEMLDQFIFTQIESAKRISNLVLMGIGEPLDNYEQVLKFLRIIGHKRGINMGFRHISISTCGIVPKIKQLSDEKIPITLSVSLHAPNNQIRNALMPVNKIWDIDTLIDACRKYVEKTGRRISFEYTMIEQVNDTAQCAQELAKKLSDFPAHINLIRANRISEENIKPSTLFAIDQFKKILENYRIAVTIRRKMGSDINAACGQLRRSHLDIAVQQERPI